MAKEHNWKRQELPLVDVREHKDFQLRVKGVDPSHASVLLRTLGDGEDLEPIRIAKVGKAHYVVDGFHRLEAYRSARRETLPVLVARMSLEEAKDEALQANTKHGKSLSRADKANRLDTYVARGKHLDATGSVKSSRKIAKELGNVYSYETVRKKLKERGIELDETVEFPGGYKPFLGPQVADETELALERQEEAESHLDGFAALYPTLEPEAQQELLGAARELVAALERGERPERVRKEPEALLDI